MKLIDLASKLKEDGGLEEILKNEIGKNDLEKILLNDDDDDNVGLSLRINFYSRYDGAAEKLKDKLITDKWNQLKKKALVKKKKRRREKR